MKLVELNSPNAVHLSLRQTYRRGYNIGGSANQERMLLSRHCNVVREFQTSSTVR
jgi:hypothetical protein